MESSFSARRLGNIKRNRDILEDLGAVAQAQVLRNSVARAKRPAHHPPAKRQRVALAEQTRSAPPRISARLAAAPAKPSYVDDDESLSESSARGRPNRSRQAKRKAPRPSVKEEDHLTSEAAKPDHSLDPKEMRLSWDAWTPSAPPPIRDDVGFFHFDSHPVFTPNKSPMEVMQEGAFGGSYFRPLYSKKLDITITDDCPATLPESLDTSYYLTSPTYNPEANKFKVACGQSIEQWEASGWINHTFDVRGWFQWYCRFFAGRRCEDDDRQVSRWKKCVGPTGRWRIMLLKKYVSTGVKTVWDDGEDEDAPEVSPVMHQTCHHWAFEVTQAVLDEYWTNGR